MNEEKKCEGHCPFCNSKNISLEDKDLTNDGSLSLIYVCDECDNAFTEWYTLVYDATTLD